MSSEVMEWLAVRPDGFYWDGTFGRGGHSRSILDSLSQQGRLWATDRDEAAQAEAGRINDRRFTFKRADLLAALDLLPSGMDGFLWDLGVSTPQLTTPQRGFSFQENGPLDMRMDQSEGETAGELINRLQEKELADLIYTFGEERLSRRIARMICEARKQDSQWTTHRLAEICTRAYPRRHHRIHPATRTFQALRIAVNDELNQIETVLPLALNRLNPSGRAVVISFHSLEDRIVKHTFKAFVAHGFRILTKRPLQANEDERAVNAASRSAKLRAIERGAP
ncbi:MAG: 16S rRNA (cytosine(1402)-N(4))-methyltransferase RsmH [Acidobacteria bacterium]|nr:16S rRNA (cytosine(1402)-N(4))-methyltransferase RsmH [Acidobacteriota bacterium]